MKGVRILGLLMVLGYLFCLADCPTTLEDITAKVAWFERRKGRRVPNRHMHEMLLQASVRDYRKHYGEFDEATRKRILDAVERKEVMQRYLGG